MCSFPQWVISSVVQWGRLCGNLLRCCQCRSFHSLMGSNHIATAIVYSFVTLSFAFWFAMAPKQSNPSALPSGYAGDTPVINVDPSVAPSITTEDFTTKFLTLDTGQKKQTYLTYKEVNAVLNERIKIMKENLGRLWRTRRGQIVTPNHFENQDQHSNQG